MTLWFFISAALILYAVFLALALNSWTRNAGKKLTPNPNQTGFSLVVPFRNEENKLPALLDSLSTIDYDSSLLEIILVDDHSTDSGAAIISDRISDFPFPIKLLHSSETGKKKALQTGISASNYDFIITTDADCLIPPQLVSCYNQIARNGVNFVAGPVLYDDSDTRFTSQYQVLENAALVVVTALGFARKKPFMANGANLCFRKKIFFELNGYDNNMHVPGGDDEFLLEKAETRFPGTAEYMYDTRALVKTSPQPNFRALLQQRIRWASKVKHKSNKGTFVLQFIVFVWCLAILASPLMLLVTDTPLYLLFVAPLLKLIFDALFFNRLKNLLDLHFNFFTLTLFSLSQILLIPVIAILSIRGNYSWKGRHYQT